MSKKIKIMKVLLSLLVMTSICNASYLSEVLQKDGIALANSGVGVCFLTRENPNNPNEITISCPKLAQQLAAVKTEEAFRKERLEHLQRERREQKAWFLHSFFDDFDDVPGMYAANHDDTPQHHTLYSDFDKSYNSYQAFAWRDFEESLKNCEPMSKKRRELERLAVLRRLSNRDKRLAQQHANTKRCAMPIKPIKKKHCN